MSRFPTRRHLEDKLHTHVWKSLMLLLPSNARAFSVETRNCEQKEGARRSARSYIAGISDLHIIYRGHAILIKLETPGGSLRPEQRAFLAKARAGAPTAICRSLNEAVAFLTEHGVRLKGALQ